MQNVREEGHHHATTHGVRRREGNMGVDEEPVRMDTSKGPVLDTSRLDPQVPVPDMAATKTPGGVMDIGTRVFYWTQE